MQPDEEEGRHGEALHTGIKLALALQGLAVLSLPSCHSPEGFFPDTYYQRQQGIDSVIILFHLSAP